MHHELTVNTYGEKEFKEMVAKEHEKGSFSGGAYRMQVNFSTVKECIDFVGISLENSSGDIVGFCGIEVLVGDRGREIGRTHCLGVPIEFRAKGYSVIAIKEAEAVTKKINPNLAGILSTANTEGSLAFQKAGFKVTNKGRTSETGRVYQIRLAKWLDSDLEDTTGKVKEQRIVASDGTVCSKESSNNEIEEDFSGDGMRPLNLDLGKNLNCRGAVHDFELFKRNIKLIPFGAFILADKGYQGIYALYPNSLLPLKAKRRCKLDPELKIYNQEINKRRIGIEHVFGSLKTFKILAERYRNRGKRLGLRFNLIAGIYNLELSKK